MAHELGLSFTFLNSWKEISKECILWHMKTTWNSSFSSLGIALLEHSHAHSLMYVRWLLMWCKSRVGQLLQRLYGSQGSEYLLSVLFLFLTEKVCWPKLYENGPKGHSLYQESVQSLFHFFTCFFIYFSIKNLLGSSLVSTIVLSTGVKRGKKFENYQKYRIKRKEGGCYRRKEHVKAWGDEIMIMTVPTL